MSETLLSLADAAAAAGYRKRALRELLRSGRLPAVRRGDRWWIAPEDLAGLMPMAAAAPAAAGREADPSHGAEALQSLLRERERELRALQDERVQLARLVGFLQAQLAEREARLALLEGRTLTPAHMGENQHRPADPEPPERVERDDIAPIAFEPEPPCAPNQTACDGIAIAADKAPQAALAVIPPPKAARRLIPVLLRLFVRRRMDPPT